MNRTPTSELPATVDGIEQLEELLSRPTPALKAELSALDGDVMIVGAGGKIGPSLARMAKRALPDRVVRAVARFSDATVRAELEKDGIETVKADLLDRRAVDELPGARNVLFLAGQKFGSSGSQPLTWAMNSYVPGTVAERFASSRIVAYSTSCVYPFVRTDSGGATEHLAVGPPGEYAMSCIGRERMFEHFSGLHGTPGRLFRLSYAVDLRYGVLVDIARKVFAGDAIDVTTGHVNVIWQGDANVMALRCLAHATTPTSPINVSGPETLSIRFAAESFARRFDRPLILEGEEADTAWLVNTGQANGLFGYPQVPLDLLLDWVADWVTNGRETLDKPTKFQVRDGRY